MYARQRQAPDFVGISMHGASASKVLHRYHGNLLIWLVVQRR